MLTHIFTLPRNNTIEQFFASHMLVNDSIENIIPVTGGEGGERVKGFCKRTHVHGDGWQLDFGGEHDVVYTEIEIE